MQVRCIEAQLKEALRVAGGDRVGSSVGGDANVHVCTERDARPTGSGAEPHGESPRSDERRRCLHSTVLVLLPRSVEYVAACIACLLSGCAILSSLMDLIIIRCC